MRLAITPQEKLPEHTPMLCSIQVIHLLSVKTFALAACATLAIAASLPAQVPAGLAVDPPAFPALASAPPSAEAYIRMSAHERWHGYLHENLLGTQFAVQVFASAFVSHIGRDPKEWGLGAHGYFHRVENRFFTAGIDGVVHSSVAAALHHDTRYHPYRGDGGGLHRAGFAIQRTLLTYNESGRRVFDISSLAGIYGSSMLATYWHPHTDPLGVGVRAGNFSLMARVGANLLKEFSPDLKRIVSRK